MIDPAAVAATFRTEAAQLEREIAEIDLLVTQARSEAARHETRRASAADKLAKAAPTASGSEVLEQANQVATLTRRVALMEAQLEILEGKRKSIDRLRETIEAHAAALEEPAGDTDAPTAASPATDDDDGPAIPPAISRIVLTAQEDLRRQIAREMHDGPAQSLTNIVLQAEIAERLLERDPAAAGREIRQLVAMVQQTLDATKTFIFDVRPMVLDDLGLVPTLRRAARERGRRAGIAVDFESVGADHRLPVELESGLFRIIDEAVVGLLEQHPERITVQLEWNEGLEAVVRADRTAAAVPNPDLPDAGGDMPPALAAMVEDRRAAHAAAIEAAAEAAVVRLPARLARQLLNRAETLGIAATARDDGALRLRLEAEPHAGEGPATS